MKALIGLIIVAAVAGGGWYWFAQDKGEMAEADTEQNAENEAWSESDHGTASFGELAKRTGPWTCDANAVHEGGSSQGTLVMNDGKLRGDFVATMQGITVETSFVGRDGYMYTWSSMMPQGFKVAMADAEGSAGGQGIDPSTQVSYSCAPWTPDESRFELPAITFVDVSAMGGAGVPQPN